MISKIKYGLKKENSGEIFKTIIIASDKKIILAQRSANKSLLSL